MSKVYLVGVGPGGEGYITEIAKRLIERADVVVGYKHALNVVKNIVDKGYDGMEKSNSKGSISMSKRRREEKDIKMITLKTQDEVYAQLLDYLKGGEVEGVGGGGEKECCILFTG
ncbi:MAG: SAM-dependent methyltransferase, partial [Candidatus Nitrosocaldus sp.]